MKITITCLLLALVFSMNAGAAIFGSDLLDYAENADALNEKIEKEYTIHRDGGVDYRFYIRTRINTYLGKKLNGDMKVPYNSAWETVTVNMARTATIKADGTRVAVSEKEINDIQDPSTSGASLFSSARQRVINFPAVEPGAQVEVEVTVHSRRPGMKAFFKREYFALQVPTAEKDVTVHIPAEMHLFWAVNSRLIEVSRSTSRDMVTWRWQGKRLPKSVDEPMSPPEMLKSPVLFLTTLPSYRAVAGFYNSLIPRGDVMAHRSDDTGPDLGHGSFSTVDMADRLYVKFMSSYRPYRIDFFDTPLEPVSLEQTLKQGYGTPLQLARLFMAELRKQGIDSDLCVVSDICDVSAIPVPYMPDLFGTFCVQVHGRWYSFETREMSPGVTGLDGRAAITLSTGRVERVRDSQENLDITVLSMQDLYDETSRGTLYSMSAGESSANTRRAFRYLSEPELAIAESMIIHTVNPLAQGNVTMLDLDAPSEPLGIKVDFRIAQPSPSLEHMTFFPVPSASMIESFARISEDRKNPVWFSDDERECLEFCLKLPLGARVESLPESFGGEAGPFSWNVSVRQEGRVIYYLRELAKKRGMLRKGPEFRKFISAIRRLSGPAQGVVVYGR